MQINEYNNAETSQFNFRVNDTMLYKFYELEYWYCSVFITEHYICCLLYTSPSPRDRG